MSNQSLERSLTHNASAEQVVLGAILAGNQSKDLALDLLKPEDFFVDRNRKIFRTMLALREARKPTDELILFEELQRTGELEATGGIEYIASLGDGIPKVGGNIEHYVRLVKDKARLRSLIHAASQIQEVAFVGGEVAEVLDGAIEKLSDLARDAEADRDEGTTYRDAAIHLLSELDKATGVRIFTGLQELDKLTGGFRAGELVVFTAETGTGKTLLAQQTRRRACRDDRHTLFCSGEMRAPHLVSRDLATEAEVEHWKMRRNDRITPEDMQVLVDAASHQCVKCRILDGELSLARIRRVARQMRGTSGLDLVVIDYDELVDAPGESEFDQQRNLARGAKSLAMELACPVILISQLRKVLTGEDVKKPTLQRLYGSGAKAKHASLVIFADREFVRELTGDETKARIAVVKNRDGKVGAFEAKFNIETLRFESAASEADSDGSDKRNRGSKSLRQEPWWEKEPKELQP